jgi:hypothetical protein
MAEVAMVDKVDKVAKKEESATDSISSTGSWTKSPEPK